MSRETPKTKVETAERGSIEADLGVGGVHIIRIPYFGSIHVIVNEFETYDGKMHKFSNISLHPHASDEGETTLTIFAESLDIHKNYVAGNEPKPHNFDIVAKR